MYFYTLENHIKVLREEELYHQRIQKVVMQARPHGVMVSTLDSESSDPSSNLGGTCIPYAFGLGFVFPLATIL